MTQKQNQVIPIVVCEKVIRAQEKVFNEIASTHNEVEFKKECFFALEVLRKSDYLMKIAMNNPQSLQAAVMNVATVGLSLSPALKLAYLLPRKGEVCLDISYMGMIQLATDTGSIQWAQAEIVYANDDYSSNGIGKRPTHNKKPFEKNRGEIIGAYSVAKTFEGDYLVTEMEIDEILNIRNRSEAWKSGKNCPWKTDFNEMAKKTVIKRSAKLWPKSDKTNRLKQAIQVVNEHEGINFEERDTTPPAESRKKELIKILKKIENGAERLLKHCCIKYQRDVKSIDDLNANELEYCVNFLNQQSS